MRLARRSNSRSWNRGRLALAALVSPLLFPVPDDALAQGARTDALAYYRQFGDSRIRALQYDLIWVGESAAVTSGRIGPGQVRAIRRFERAAGLSADGVLRRDERRFLRREADRIRDRVGYRITIDPGTGARLGIPFALVGRGMATPNGTRWRTGDGKVVLETKRERLRGTLRDAYRRELAKEGRTVTYKLLRSRFFVVTGRENGRSFYTRVQSDGSELRSFTVGYASSLEGVFDPIIVAMSNDFDAFAASPARDAVPVPQLNEPPAPGAIACAPRIRVASGDTLSRIAKRCGTSVVRLRRANNAMDPLDLQAGQTLAIPRPGETLPPLPAPVAMARPAAPETSAPEAAAPETAAVEPEAVESEAIEPQASGPARPDALPDEPTGFDESGEPPATTAEPEVAARTGDDEPLYAPTAIFLPQQPIAGRRITVSATGFPPSVPVELSFSRTNSSMRAVETGRTDAQGRVTFRTPLPDWLEAGQSSAVVIAAPAENLAATTETFMVRSAPSPGAEREPEREPVLISGMTTSENGNCATMRDLEGQRYNLLGEVADYEAGTAVRVLGFPTTQGGCGEDPTIDVTTIERRP